MFEPTPQVVSHSVEPRRRSINEILARRQQRLNLRRETFAPDFLHGEARLGELYDALGENWVEQAIFMEEIFDGAGQRVAVTMGYFVDYFLTIEQAVVHEVGDLDEWIEERTGERATRVQLIIESNAYAPAVEHGDESGVIGITCGQARLVEMESALLNVTRDGEDGNRDDFDAQQEAVLQGSRTNLMSLVGLCARLIT